MQILFAVVALLQAALNPSDFPTIKKLADNVYAWSDVHPTGLYTTNDHRYYERRRSVADGQKDPDTTRKMVERIKALTPQLISYGSSAPSMHHTAAMQRSPTVTFIRNRRR